MWERARTPSVEELQEEVANVQLPQDKNRHKQKKRIKLNACVRRLASRVCDSHVFEDDVKHVN